MRIMLTLCGILAALCWTAQAASAQNYRDTTGDAINPEKSINQTRNTTHIQLGQETFAPIRSYRARSYAPSSVAVTTPPSVRAGQQSGADEWRYRRHNGQWWYYQTNKQWVVWNGSRWTEPMAKGNATQNQNSSHQ
jgi:hypothetical protein